MPRTTADLPCHTAPARSETAAMLSWLPQIPLPCAHSARLAQKHLDQKTKPRGSLGVLETLICRLAAMQGCATPHTGKRALVVMAADHGIAEEGVSAYPQSVTVQMLHNFLSGSAAANILANWAGAQLELVDMGVRTAWTPSALGSWASRLRVCRLGAGSENFLYRPAMTHAQAVQGIRTGVALAQELHAQGVCIVAAGEMGIGNTTVSSALSAQLSGAEAEAVTGRGTGISLAGWRHKVALVQRAVTLHRPAIQHPLDALACLGGFEIAGLAGLMLGGAACRMAILLDGFISSAAALLALRLDPALLPYLIATHRSPEPGHGVVLRTLGLRPLLKLQLRLGEGSGAALGLGLIAAAGALSDNMATFASAGVDDGSGNANQNEARDRDKPRDRPRNKNESATNNRAMNNSEARVAKAGHGE